MPMDESRHVELVGDANLELLSHFCDKARCAIRLANAEHRCRLSVHFDAAPLDTEDRNRLGFFPSDRGGRLRPDSKTDRRAQPKNRGVGDPPYSGVDWINHAAARAKDVLEIGLHDPAGSDLRLIANFERELIGADRQSFAREKSRVTIKGADRWGEL